MPRAERLLRLADLLRGREATSVASLAQEVGVSRRSLLRDLATLRAHGLPITGESGPGGGVRLEGDRGVTAVHLSVGEIVALWLAARLSRAASDLPWSGGARSGLAKLLGSVPRARAQELRALCARVYVGTPASEKVRAGAGAAPPDLLRRFEEAFAAGIGLGFACRDGGGRSTVRRIEPHGLLVQPPVWYLLARDLDKGEPRTFRMDRVSRPILLRDVRFRPDAAVIERQIPRELGWLPLSAS
jgi:predicted DNA-binding transcriptional regulator YafY